MTKTAVLALVLPMLVGCANHWTHATKTEDEFHQDAQACHDERSRSPTYLGFFSNCMRGKGWREK